MNTISKVLVAGLLGLVACANSASACENRCRVQRNVQVVPQNVPQLNAVPQPIPNPPAVGNGLSQNDSVINDLPVDAKRAIRAAAAKVRTNVPSRTVSNSRTPVNRSNR